MPGLSSSFLPSETRLRLADRRRHLGRESFVSFSRPSPRAYRVKRRTWMFSPFTAMAAVVISSSTLPLASDSLKKGCSTGIRPFLVEPVELGGAGADPCRSSPRACPARGAARGGRFFSGRPTSCGTSSRRAPTSGCSRRSAMARVLPPSAWNFSFREVKSALAVSPRASTPTCRPCGCTSPTAPSVAGGQPSSAPSRAPSSAASRAAFSRSPPASAALLAVHHPAPVLAQFLHHRRRDLSHFAYAPAFPSAGAAATSRHHRPAAACGPPRPPVRPRAKRPAGRRGPPRPCPDRRRACRAASLASPDLGRFASAACACLPAAVRLVPSPSPRSPRPRTCCRTAGWSGIASRSPGIT